MKVHFVKKARKDVNDEIKAGDSYYWWKFRFGAKRVSKTHPKRSQLTNSEYLSTAYDCEDELQAATYDDIEDVVASVLSQLEEIKSTAEERLENIPDQLKDASSGQTLQEYIDNFDSWISQLEGLDFQDDDSFLQEAEDSVDEVDEEDLRTQARLEVESSEPQGDDEEEEAWKERIESLVDQRFEELKTEAQDARQDEVENKTEELKSEYVSELLSQVESPF